MKIKGKDRTRWPGTPVLLAAGIFQGVLSFLEPAIVRSRLPRYSLLAELLYLGLQVRVESSGQTEETLGGRDKKKKQKE